ncbi:sigma-70 family RNA polymerase sigma factor [Snuella sedimenti]|uniref:Sigma-70 family RNA polymerase sigma factor n=1 Tax=Snuella sedimenti TaxID=2798802 RepID=A0A8J7IHN7_9FLAO|nr:sigma-70 family RNA polymerase sigma factor [Snuella sedimenti]MBJ6368628.1 sigma-70 family RNA polymerase sigma factor [Snuella sedimenti]
MSDSNKYLMIERYFKENHTYLTVLSFKIVKDKDIAKDIVQEFFLHLWNRKDLFVLNTSFKAYSTKAIKNLSVTHLEKSKKEKLIIEQLKVAKVKRHEDFQIPSFNSKILDLLDKLPEKRRKILISSIIHGQKYSDIAEDNSISINTVKTQIKRAYTFFKENYNYSKALFILALYNL